jgi:hypothetical protein
MCKFSKFLSKLGLFSILLSIIVMVMGWFSFNINCCIISMILMSVAAISFILCMICNCGNLKKDNK